MLIAFTFLTLLVSPLFIATNLAAYVLVAGQLAILIAVIREKHLTGVTAFIFMSFLFFAVRPIYMITENDYSLFSFPFRISPSRSVINTSIWWATTATTMFYVGACIAKNFHLAHWKERFRIAEAKQTKLKVVGYQMIILLMVYQVITLGVMVAMSNAGRSLYTSALGAYIYDFPAVMQAGHVFALLLSLELYLRNRTPASIGVLALTGLFFVIFSFEMRNISMFRGFYLTGVMAGGIACLARLKPRVNPLWLILPVMLLLPAFRWLGENRYAKNDSLVESRSVAVNTSVKQAQQSGFLRNYWDFYNSDGDINILDTFIAADISRPRSYPYILSWLYVPVHLVPRAVWESKPKAGTLQDMTFTYDAPYSPGIAGFFLLDGGRVWMLLCMTTLGYLIAYLDFTILTMPRTYLRYCLYGIVVVNALGLSRYFLWQYFYSVLYGIIPCLILAKIVGSKPNNSRRKIRNPSRDLRRRDADELEPIPPNSQTRPS